MEEGSLARSIHQGAEGPPLMEVRLMLGQCCSGQPVH
jgi:hypothetical protein